MQLKKLLGLASQNRLCRSNKIMVMKSGRVTESGTRDEVIFNQKDEYTKTLLAALPIIGSEPYYAA